MRLSFFIILALWLPNLNAQKIVSGAERFDSYLSKLNGKRIGITCNHTSMVGDTHLVDFLLSKKYTIQKIFAPEHGFRGQADAGAKVNSETDPKTGVRIQSLYGKNLKPKPEDLKDIDVMLFDIQDVGVRFYTYISTLQFILEACAEAQIPVILMDRPNPNGYYIDGPVLDKKYKSFVGMQSVPVVYGMTIGEYARMIIGEKWLDTDKVPQLEIITCLNYHHKSKVSLPVPPSPNLKSERAIFYYPSLCFFEGTHVSVGRGTDFPFECYGSPYIDKRFLKDSFMPMSKVGAMSPPFKGEWCYGEKLMDTSAGKQLNLFYLLTALKYWTKDKKEFFLSNLFFDKLAGNSTLRWQLIQGRTENEIRDSWKTGIAEFRKIRAKYLLYEDF